MQSEAKKKRTPSREDAKPYRFAVMINLGHEVLEVHTGSEESGRKLMQMLANGAAGVRKLTLFNLDDPTGNPCVVYG